MPLVILFFIDLFDMNQNFVFGHGIHLQLFVPDFIKSISHHRQCHKHQSGSDACTSLPIVRQPLQTPGMAELRAYQYRIRNHPNTPTIHLPQSLFVPVIAEHDIPTVSDSRYSPIICKFYTDAVLR
jgi:hypothetical protein